MGNWAGIVMVVLITILYYAFMLWMPDKEVKSVFYLTSLIKVALILGTFIYFLTHLLL